MYTAAMPLSKCSVTFTDGDGVAHRLEVQAQTLYEAAAIALKQFRDDEFTKAAVEATASFDIELVQTPVVHTVRLQRLLKYANTLTGTPAERTRRLHIKALLG